MSQSIHDILDYFREEAATWDVWAIQCQREFAT